jgi:hypothetical protein
MDQFKAWLDSPFKGDMSAIRWFAFVGLLIAIASAWHVILNHLKDA